MMRFGKFEKLLLAALAVIFVFMAFYIYRILAKPICKGTLLNFSQANFDGDMEPFSLEYPFGHFFFEPTKPGLICVEIKTVK
jgi:hypothetical protein